MRLMKKLATLATLLTSPPVGGEFFHSVNEGRGYFLIHRLREEQRHVDVDAFAEQLPKCGNAFRRCPAL